MVNKSLNIFFIAILLFGLSSCMKSKNSPGYEYMPDMYRSPAIEAYVDYGEVRGVWRGPKVDSLKNRQSALVPPFGTIPYKGKGETAEWNMKYHRLPGEAWVKSHGIVSQEFDNTAYEAAAADKSPIPYTAKNAAKGEELYNRFCTHCHGETGKGDGPVPTNSVLGVPANAFDNVPEGKMFYSITYGKGLMGSHASQLTPEERWEVIAYVKKLRNGGEYPYAEDGINPDLMNMAKAASGEKATDSTGAPILSASDAIKKLTISDLYFATGSAKINKRRSRKSLNDLIAVLSLYEGIDIELSGHTDNTGDPSKNKILSQDRADAVKNYLASYGIDADRITAVGYGDTQPIASNDTDEGRAKNRRTEIIIK